MAERPVFVPTPAEPHWVHEVRLPFKWHSGFSSSQKKKNVLALRDSAKQSGIAPVLEVSSQSDLALGRALSAFNLRTDIEGLNTTVECAFQGSKVFAGGGPYTDLYETDSRSAKTDERLRRSGRLVQFQLQGTDYPLDPPTVFYDWLYITALSRLPVESTALLDYAGFTDIEFNPERSLNCQARSCALFVALRKAGAFARASRPSPRSTRPCPRPKVPIRRRVMWHPAVDRLRGQFEPRIPDAHHIQFRRLRHPRSPLGAAPHTVRVDGKAGFVASDGTKLVSTPRSSARSRRPLAGSSCGALTWSGVARHLKN
ncbi:DarT1-associated NADAR antitoxin family protein [Prosthecodimorpha staleyi]|uniref:Uncharacterized protein n=1 Tax=Prosthecodimorpha staleyi TaxID=2840188 RepID=A0A947GD60_9HYPH|nr:hypothetical protein [Prosthecodimorpha staleyi]MBT9287945.1 hypothetical protein [Prosthecodimorpha staleyi]